MLKKLSTSYMQVYAVPQSAARLSDLMLQLERGDFMNPAGRSAPLKVGRPSTTTNAESLTVQGRKSKRFMKPLTGLHA